MKKIIAIMSGKGGVGKSSVSILLSQIISEYFKTIIVDFDICGPSVTRALNVKSPLIKNQDGFIPVKVSETLSVLSFGSILNPNDTVIWRGPKKIGFLDLFYNSITDFEFVVIDTPPGISEEHGFLVDKPIAVVLITTPQNIALNDTQRCIEFCVDNKIEIIGLVENMSFYKCGNCDEKHFPFGSKGGKLLADEYHLNFLGELEIDPNWSKTMDDGSLPIAFKNLKAYPTLKEIFETSILNMK